MSVVVRPATEADIESIVDLLYGHMSSKVPKERWRRLLDYPWRPPDADRGMVAVDGERAVGFLGLVYADRVFGGRIERFCNICAWYLLKDYRGRGIGQEIQFRSVADPELTYTIMTATAATGRAFATNSGFSVLDDTRYLLRRGGGNARSLDIADDPEAIAPLLPLEELAILRDHQHYNLRHLLVRSGEGGCYILMQVKRKGDDIDYHEVMYASDQGFLAAHALAIADAILGPGKEIFAIDARFLPGAPAFEVETLRLPRWHRAPRLVPAQIDHLYGEVALLDLKLP